MCNHVGAKEPGFLYSFDVLSSPFARSASPRQTSPVEGVVRYHEPVAESTGSLNYCESRHTGYFEWCRFLPLTVSDVLQTLCLPGTVSHQGLLHKGLSFNKTVFGTRLRVAVPATGANGATGLSRTYHGFPTTLPILPNISFPLQLIVPPYLRVFSENQLI